MKNLNIWLYIALIMGLILSGCDKRTDETRSNTKFEGMNQESLLPEGQYPDLNRLIGEMSMQDLMEFLQNSMNILNAYDNSAYTTKEDYQTMLNLMENLRDSMSENIAAADSSFSLSENLAAALKIISGNDIEYPGCATGDILDRLIKRLGPGCMEEEIYTMLEYIMEADTATLEGALSGLDLDTITAPAHETSFNNIIDVIHDAADPDARYANIYEGLFDYNGDQGILDQLIAVPGNEITIGDLETVLTDLQDIDLSAGDLINTDTETRLDQAIDALIKIMDGNASLLGPTDMENIIGLLHDTVAWLNAGACDNWVEWTTDTAYKKTGGVNHNNVLYLCTDTHTSAANTEPGIGAGWETYWAAVSTWTTDTAYIADNRVYHDKVLYKCISGHTSFAADEPGVGANWETFWDTASMDPGVMKSAITELLDLFATDPTTRQALKDLLYSTGLLLTSEDMEGILIEAEDNILNPAVTPRDTLKAFLQNAMMDLPAATDDTRTLPDDLVDICKKIAQISDADIPEIDTGLYEYFAQRDRFGEPRSVVPDNESALVSIIKATNNADIALYLHVKASILGIPIYLDFYALDTIDPAGSYGISRNVSQFLMGEIVRAVKYRWGGDLPSVNDGGAPSDADYNGSGAVDPNEAIYWLFWEKKYDASMTSAGFTFSAEFHGVINMSFMRLDDLKNAIIGPPPIVIPDKTNYAMDLGEPEVNDGSTVYLGRIRDFIPALAALSGWDYAVSTNSGHVTAVTPVSDPATDTPQHSLIALMAPLMESFYDRGRLDLLVSLLTGMLDHDTLDTVYGLDVADYDGNYTTATILQALEGTNGEGLLTKALRSHGDEGILDPLLGASTKIIGRLDDSGVLDNLVTELNEVWGEKYDNPEVDADKRFIDTFIKESFVDTDAQDRTWIDRLEIFLYTNHAALVTLTNDLGNLIINNEATDIDPLLAYITGGLQAQDNRFFSNLKGIWDNGVTWDKLNTDIDTLNTGIKNITGKESFGLLDNMETLLDDLDDLDNPPADIADRPVSELALYLLEDKDGWNYNPFVDSLLNITLKTLDLYDETYNPGGEINRDLLLVQAVNSLTTNLLPMQNLVAALTAKKVAPGSDTFLIWQLLCDTNDLSKAIMGTEDLSTAFLQAMFKKVEVDGGTDSVISAALGLMELEAITGEEVSMQGVMDDLYWLMEGSDLKPGGDLYATIHSALGFVVQNSSAD
ncbi:MAG: hypothetical protein U9P80_03400 [Thermodesulfobacteriota bacterium]|nr:hypothetical protein [Thermodesulfobacteriota bacterium]